jgi:hypothetical protein
MFIPARVLKPLDGELFELVFGDHLRLKPSESLQKSVIFLL